MLALAFEHLGVPHAITSAVTTNHAPLGVSRGLDYRDNGITPHGTGDEIADLQHLIMDLADWLARRRDALTVNGFGACRPFVGPD